MTEKGQNWESVIVASRGIEGSGPNLPFNFRSNCVFYSFFPCLTLVYCAFYVFSITLFLFLLWVGTTWDVRDAYEVACLFAKVWD